MIGSVDAENELGEALVRLDGIESGGGVSSGAADSGAVERKLADALVAAWARVREVEAERDRLRAMAGSITARGAGMLVDVIEASRKVSAATFSHIDGRDLLAELHPRRMLDIKRRVDGRETWFQGDWLSTLWDARKKLDAVLAKIDPSSASETAPIQESAAATSNAAREDSTAIRPSPARPKGPSQSPQENT